MKDNWYETPASNLNMTARELVLNRLNKLADLIEDGRHVKDTSMTRAFIASVK